MKTAHGAMPKEETEAMADDLPPGATLVKPVSDLPPGATLVKPVSDEPSFLDKAKEFDQSVAQKIGAARSTVGDIGRGVANAPISIAGGLAETAALVVDYGLGTNTASQVEKTFDAIKNVTGAKTKAGQITDDVVSFGASFLMPALWVSKATSVARGMQTGKGLLGFAPKSKIGKKLDNLAVSFGNSASGKALLNPKVLGVRPGAVALTAAGTAPISFAVSPSGRATLSDSVDWMPDLTKTDQEQVQGRDETTRRIGNKFKNAVEDTAMGGIFDVGIGLGLTAAKGVGRGVGAVARSEPVQPVVQATKDIYKRVYDAGLKDSMAENFVKKNLTSFRGLDPKVAIQIELGGQQGKEVDRVTYKGAQDFDKAARQVLQSALKNSDQSPIDMGIIKRDLEEVLGGKKLLEDLPYLTPELGRSIQRMQQVSARSTDDLVNVLEEEIALNPLTGRAEKAQEALDIIKANQAAGVTHLRRLFQRHEDPVSFYKQLDLDSPEYTQTVGDMVNYMTFSKQFAADASDAQKRVLAEDEVRTMLGLAATSSGLSNKQLIKKVRKEIRLAETVDDGSVLVARIPKMKQATDLLESRATFMDQSQAARSLLKMVDEDAVGLWRKTVNDTANLVATRDFYQSMGAYSLNDARELVQQGGRPLIVRPPPDDFLDSPVVYQKVKEGEAGFRPGLAPEMQPTLREVIEEEMKDLSGYVKLGEESSERVFGGQFGELSGLYVAPEFYQSITAPYKLKSVALDYVLSLFQKARAGSQKLTVVPSITANVRQMFGNGLTLGSNANMGADNVTLALRTQIASYADLEDEGLEHLARKLSAAGVADEGVIINTMKEYREVGKEFSTLEAPNKLFDKIGDALGMRYFEKFYSGTDTVAKGAGLLGEEGKLLDVFKAAGIAENNPTINKAFMENKLFSGAGMSAQEARAGSTGKRKSFTYLTPVELQAAEIVKNTMPTYSRIVEAAKFVDKIPIVGNFTSFAAENTRNAFNTVGRGMREMAFEISPSIRQELVGEGYTEAQIAGFEQGIRGNGAQRLAAFGAINSVLPNQLVKMSMQANGLSQEEYDAILQSSVPDYLKESGHHIMILDTYGPGRYQAIDLSYTFPYAYLSDAANAAVQTYQLKGKLGKSEVEAAASAALNGLSRFGEPFTQETMIFERIMDVMPESVPAGRAGKTKAMGTVYDTIDDGWDRAIKSAAHIFGGLTPEYTRLILTEKNGKVVPGRLTKTVFGMESRQGVESKYHDPYVEAMRLVSGFTPMELDSRTALEFAGKEYAGNRSDIRGAASAVLGNMESSDRQILNRWDDYLDALYKEQSRLYFEVQNMRTLGLSETEIRQQLVRDAKIGRAEAAKIVNGMFAPSNASNATLAGIRKEALTEGTVRRATDLVKLQGDMNTRFLQEVNKPLQYDAPLPPGATLVDPTVESSWLPFVSPAAAATMPPMPPAMTAPVRAAPPVSAPQGQVDPTLLGGAPATQALAKSLGRAQ